MELISIERNTDRDTGELIAIVIWIDDGTYYKKYRITPDDKAQEQKSIPKDQYDNYIHFVGVMGKFNPYTYFLIEPLPITGIDFDQIRDRLIDVEKMTRGSK